MNLANSSTELPGLRVKIDRIVYVHDTDNLPTDAPHAFIYFITIINLSNNTVTLKNLISQREMRVSGDSLHQNS